MNILVVCAVGMSSSVIVSKLREEVKNNNYSDIKIGASSVNDFEQYLNKTDVLVLAPQISYITDNIQFNKKIVVISNADYGNLDAGSILSAILNDEKGKEIKTNFLYKISNILNKARLIKAINKSFMAVLPVTLIGSIFSILYGLKFLDINLLKLFSLGSDMSIGCISVYVVFMLGYFYGEESEVDGNTTGLFSLMNFFILVSKTEKFIDLYYLGVNGLFSAIIIAYVSSKFTVFLLKKNKVRDFNYPKTVIKSFIAIIPGIVNIVVASIIIFLIRLTPFESFPELIEIVLQRSMSNFLGNSIPSYLFFGVLINIFWFFGIHGGNVVKPITNPVYIPLALENIKYFEADLALPNLINNTTVYMYTFGGAGSTLGLLILILLFGKSTRFKSVSKISFLMGIFGINEPVLFGLPIIFNPILFIPFVFVGPICGFVTLVAMKLQLIPYAIGYQIPWNTPIVISGFIQGGLILALWQILMLVLSMVLWFPFFKLIDNREYKEENKNMPN